MLAIVVAIRVRDANHDKFDPEASKCLFNHDVTFSEDVIEKIDLQQI